MESSKPCKLGFCGSRLRFEMASCDWPMLGRVCVNSLHFQIWGNWADGYPENEGYRLLSPWTTLMQALGKFGHLLPQGKTPLTISTLWKYRKGHQRMPFLS